MKYAVNINIIRTCYMYAECNEYVNVVNVIRSCCNGTNVDTAVNMELTAKLCKQQPMTFSVLVIFECGWPASGLG